MKHLKLFESFSENIESICEKFGIINYTVNSDGTVDVDGNVDISMKKLKELPLKFGKVSGSFTCHKNELITLEGAPSEVGSYFWCYDNKLTTLEGSPKEVSEGFFCGHNNLITLEGAPRKVGESFYCESNKLKSLEGAPIEVGGDFLRGMKIVKHRFKEALDELGVEIPESIPGYKYIYKI